MTSSNDFRALYWEIEALRAHGAHRGLINARRREAAELHEERARVYLAEQNPLGWIDLFSSITYRAEAGERDVALSLLGFADDVLSRQAASFERLRTELGELRVWLDGLPVVSAVAQYQALEEEMTYVRRTNGGVKSADDERLNDQMERVWRLLDRGQRQALKSRGEVDQVVRSGNGPREMEEAA